MCSPATSCTPKRKARPKAGLGFRVSGFGQMIPKARQTAKATTMLATSCALAMTISMVQPRAQRAFELIEGVIIRRIFLFPKQCLQHGVLTLRVKELVTCRNGARGGGAGPSFRRSRCGFARIPLRFDAHAVISREFRPLLASSGGGHLDTGRGLRFDAPAVVPREFRCVSMLPLWFRAHSGLRLRAATARAVRRGLRFDAPAVVSRKFRCVSMLLALLTVWGLRRHSFLRAFSSKKLVPCKAAT